ncbi:MAG: hypothetical protein JWP78_786 [Mucilaginibacter sp.]|jgi:hypothetical protein|nr:hypothetical protein [Mucilaginibacter sp.]
MKQALIYSLKVWITGVVMTLIITWTADIAAPYAFSQYLYSGFFGRIVEIWLLSLAYVVPFCLCVMVLFTFDLKASSIKVTLTLLTLVLAWLPVLALTMIVDEPVSLGFKLEAVVYIFLNCLCISFYRLKPVFSNSESKNNKFPHIKQIKDISRPSPSYS